MRKCPVIVTWNHSIYFISYKKRY